MTSVDSSTRELSIDVVGIPSPPMHMTCSLDTQLDNIIEDTWLTALTTAQPPEGRTPDLIPWTLAYQRIELVPLACLSRMVNAAARAPSELSIFTRSLLASSFSVAIFFTIRSCAACSTLRCTVAQRKRAEMHDT